MDDIPTPSRHQQIVTAARRLLEDRGPEALSMRNVAAAIGIRAPSLYEHVADKQGLENALIAAGLREQAAALNAALDGPGDPLQATANAWRAWAGAHPHLYRLIFARQLDADDPEVSAAAAAAGEPVRAMTRGDLVAARVIWAFAHGMTMLELNGRFPPGPDPDELWESGLGALRALIDPVSR
jgi:AcrR family transcriptional regulator